MIMASASSLRVTSGKLLLSTRQLSSSNSQSSTVINWGLNRDQGARPFSRRTKNQAVRVLANPNVSRGKEYSKKEVIMVDPLEAKRLAKKQMEQIKAKERFKRRRQIEAINGAWAMIGLTAGLVIEGRTGQSILSQLAGYWAAFFSIFSR